MGFIFRALFFALVTLQVPRAIASGAKDCGEDVLNVYTSEVKKMCDGTVDPVTAANCKAEAACYPVLKAKVDSCQASVAKDASALTKLQATLDQVDAGAWASVKTTTESAKTDMVQSGAMNTAPSGSCSTIYGKNASIGIDKARGKAGIDGANSAVNAGQTGDAAGGLLGGSKGWIMPALLGAGAGALIGGMLGGDEDDDGGDDSPIVPPSLPPMSSSSSVSSTATTSSSSSTGNVSVGTDRIDNPTVATVPTLKPNAEAGGGDTEIFVPGNVVVGDDLEEDRDTAVSSTTTSAGGETNGGAAGGDTGLDNTNNDNDDVVVTDDDGASLASGKTAAGARGLASTNATTPAFDFGSGASSEPTAGSGSGMLDGKPGTGKARTVTKKLRSTSSANNSVRLATSSRSLASTTIPTSKGAKGVRVTSILPQFLPAQSEAERVEQANKIKQMLIDKKVISK